MKDMKAITVNLLHSRESFSSPSVSLDWQSCFSFWLISENINSVQSSKNVFQTLSRNVMPCLPGQLKSKFCCGLRLKLSKNTFV